LISLANLTGALKIYFFPRKNQMLKNVNSAHS
jgi:hypothetical protein